MEIEIGRGRKARRAYGFDELAIVPSRQTIDPEDIDITTMIAPEIGPLELAVPILGAAMDGVVSPETAIKLGKLGALGILNLEGLWTRYKDPTEAFERIATCSPREATKLLQMLYLPPIDEELVVQRIAEIKGSKEVTAVSITPQRVRRLWKAIERAEPDLLVVQGTVVSAEHVSAQTTPLNLKEFVREIEIPVIVGNCATYEGALHLMRTGAIGVLVGVGPGHACTSRQVLGIGVPQATAIADAVGARLRHLQETGQNCAVIADGGMATGGDIAKAIALGADAVVIGSPLAAAAEAPGHGYHWGMATPHPGLPRGTRVSVGQLGTLREILLGPAHENDGRLNLTGALRMAMATAGYAKIKDFHRAELVIAPAIKTEGKDLQRAQGVGMGALA